MNIYILAAIAIAVVGIILFFVLKGPSSSSNKGPTSSTGSSKGPGSITVDYSAFLTLPKPTKSIPSLTYSLDNDKTRIPIPLTETGTLSLTNTGSVIFDYQYNGMTPKGYSVDLSTVKSKITLIPTEAKFESDVGPITAYNISGTIS